MECADTIRKRPQSLKPEKGGPITPEDAVLISVTKPPVALQDNCDYRWGLASGWRVGGWVFIGQALQGHLYLVGWAGGWVAVQRMAGRC